MAAIPSHGIQGSEHGIDIWKSQAPWQSWDHPIPKIQPFPLLQDREQPLPGRKGFAAYSGTSGFFQNIPSFPLGFIPLLVPPAPPIPQNQQQIHLFMFFFFFFCGINQLTEDSKGMRSIPHIPSSHWDQLGACRNHILGNQKLGNCCPSQACCRG